MPSNEEFLTRFNALLDAYFSSNPTLSDAQQMLRTVMSQASYRFIGAHMTELVITGGGHPIGPHRGTDIWHDPALLLTGAALAVVEENVALRR